MYLDYIICFSSIVLNIINDNLIIKNKYPSNRYFRDGFIEWISALDEKEKKFFRNNHNKFKNRYEPRYILRNNNIILVFPIHKFSSDVDYKSLKIELTIGKNKYTYTDELKIKTIFGGYSLELDEKNITRDIDNIRYRLIETKNSGQEKVVYDSRHRLKRNYLVFDYNGEEIKNNQKYSGIVSLVSKGENYKCKNSLTVGDYFINSFKVNENDIIEIENSFFSFGEDNKIKISGTLIDRTYIKDYQTDRKIDVYKSIDKIIVSVDHQESKVFLDGKEIDNTTNHKIKIRNLKSGLHKVELKNNSNIDEAVYFAVDKSFNYCFECDEKCCSKIRLESDLINKTIVKSLDRDSFNENWNVFRYTGKKYKYIIPLEYNLYNVSGKWKTIYEDLYIEDFYNAEGIIKVYGSNIKELRVYDEFGKRVVDVIIFNKKYDYKNIDLSKLLKIYNKTKYFKLEFSDYNNSKFGFYIYNQCIIDDEIIFDYTKDNELNLLCHYEGSGSVYLRILDKHRREVYISDQLEKYTTIMGIKLMPLEEYTFEFIQMDKSNYGLSKKYNYISVNNKNNKQEISDTILIKKFNKTFFNYEDLISKKYKIDKLLIQYFKADYYEEKEYYIRNTYVKILKEHRKDRFSYIGEIFIETDKNQFRLDYLGEVIVELCSEEVNGDIELSILTRTKDGLLFESEKKRIYNGIDNHNLSDIYSHSINICNVD